jgi:hypothetical protein
VQACSVMELYDEAPWRFISGLPFHYLTNRIKYFLPDSHFHPLQLRPLLET